MPGALLRNCAETAARPATFSGINSLVSLRFEGEYLTQSCTFTHLETAPMSFMELSVCPVLGPLKGVQLYISSYTTALPSATLPYWGWFIGPLILKLLIYADMRINTVLPVVFFRNFVVDFA